MTTITITQTFTSKTRNGGGGGAIPPSNTVAPVISGSSDIGSVLTTTDGTWTGTAPITYTYQWKQSGNPIIGETNSTYTLVVADYSRNITCEVTATNVAGSSSATSNGIICTGVAPVNTVAPVISGTPTVGQTLSSTTGTWTGNPTPTYTYQWKRNGSNIASATSSTYILVQADATFAITCAVTGTNVVGAAEATSNSLTIFDADAQAFIIAAGITDNTQKTAVNQLTVDLKAASIWTKMKAIYPFVGGTATTHKFNLKNPLDTNAAFRLVFAGGWTHSSNGALPNGTNAYANTFLNSATHLSLNSGHMSYYSRTNNSAASLRIDMGSLKSGPDSYTDLDLGNSGSWYFRFNNSAAYNFVSATDTSGFFNGNRTASNVINLFRNGSKVISGTAASNATSSTNYFIGASNNHGGGSTDTPQYFSNRECAFASIGDGLTDTEALVFNQIVEGYQYALGRNINPVNVNYYNTAYNNETNAFLYASQITDNTQKSAVNTFVNDLKTAGIWTKMKAVYLFVGGTASTHKWNLVNPQDTNAAFRLTFTGGWTHSSTGALPNGTNGYANTFFNTDDVTTAGLQSYGVYLRTNPTFAVNTTEASTGLRSGIYWIRVTNTLPTTSNIRSGNRTENISGVTGLIGHSRSTTTQWYVNNNSTILVGSTTASTLSPETVNTFSLGAYNDLGSITNFSTQQLAFAFYGEPLLSSEMTNYYTAIQTFQTTLGRQV